MIIFLQIFTGCINKNRDLIQITNIKQNLHYQKLIRIKRFNLLLNQILLASKKSYFLALENFK